jgi:hypothetical protein
MNSWFVGWVERSETRRALQMRHFGGFRCALPTLRTLRFFT